MKTTRHNYFQLVLPFPAKTLIGSYTTKSGKVKNRYQTNLKVDPIKGIKHAYTTTI